MWSLFKKSRSLKESGIFEGFVDYHSHILPGVDDGVESIDESLRILQVYEQRGVTKVWLTPHIMEDFPNTTAHLRERFEELKSHYHGSIQLRLASENMLDNLFEERLNRNDLLPLGEKGDYLLVETSYLMPPVDLMGVLSRIKAKGYHPVLAHPERYVYMNKAYYEKLHQLGVKFQLNLLSLTGGYGSSVRKNATHLLSLGQYSFVGSDLHNLDGFERRINEKVELQLINKVPR